MIVNRLFQFLFIFLLMSCSSLEEPEYSVIKMYQGGLQNYGENVLWHRNAILRNKKFRVVQLGDSHTAADFFTDTLRQRLQQHLGNGGIGSISPISVNGQRSAAVKIESDGWQLLNSRRTQADFPLGGIIARSSGKGKIVISARTPTHQVQNITLTIKPIFTTHPLRLISNGKATEISALKANQWQYHTLSAHLPLTIESAENDLWELGQINIEQSKSGATISALGLNGARLSQWQQWRQDWLKDLAQIQPDLIIISYGTNEAFDDTLDIAKTEQLWRTQIQQIKRTLPNAKILFIGAPESLQSKPYSCDSRPIKLDAVQAMQQRLAQQEKLLYWSWQHAMGGKCSMLSWISQGLAAKDGVHFSAAGYKKAANQLADELIRVIR